MKHKPPEPVNPLGLFGPIPTTALRDPNLSPKAKVTLAYLASYWQNGKECYPSIKRISHETGSTPRTTQRALRELQNKHWIIRKWRLDDTTLYSPGPNLGIASPFWTADHSYRFWG